MSDGIPRSQSPIPRRSERLPLTAEVLLRRCGRLNYHVQVYDISRHGCRLEFVERPDLRERVWVKFEGIEALESLVCWVGGFVAGIEFGRPIHAAVFDQLVKRLADP